MEIERKWMVTDWPEQLPLLYEERMRQGYISVRPTVRIREEARIGGRTAYVLCFKSGTGIVRKEIEMEIPLERFQDLEDLIGLPLILKIRRTYALPDGHKLEVNLVDEGLPTEFMYAEVEYETEEIARGWVPPTAELSRYLNHDVSEEPGQSMGAFWEMTRLRKSGVQRS